MIEEKSDVAHSDDMAIIFQSSEVNSVQYGGLKIQRLTDIVISDPVPSTDAQDSSYADHLKGQKSILILLSKCPSFCSVENNWKN